MTGRWLSYLAARAILRVAARLVGWLALAAVAVAATPVTLVGAGAVGAAWLRGWLPRKRLVAGALAWAYRSGSLAAGAGGLSPGASVAFDRRQWRPQVRTARARIAAPGSVPLTVRGDLVVTGAVIRSVGHRAGPLAAIGYQRMRSHQVVVGTTGTGKIG